MFKSARWRSDKSKIKAVFKLQFHATQLAAIGGDALTIAVIPSDVGKPTARLEKTKVKDGSCYWEKPHFETVKFTQDHKTGKINEKIYRFIVATGTSVFGVAGEASLDFSKYSEAGKAASLSLPLKYAKSSSVLHVSIQRVQDQREVNESENVDEDNKGHISNGDVEESLQSDSIEDHEVLTDTISRDHGASSVSDITLSGSDSSSGLDTPWEAEPKDTKRDWLDGSVHELSTDEEGSPDDVIKKLKGELVILARQAEVSEMEIQTLRKQIVKESKRSQDLSKEVIALKEERNELKEECEKMKVKVKVKVNNKLFTEGGDSLALVDELRQELNYEKDLNSNLRLQLQKTQESNAELIIAVRDLDEMLESKSKSKCQEVNSKPETDDEDQKALEDIVKQHSGMKDAYLQEQKIIDLYNEIELYKRDKDELETQMEHIALDYEILKQENHDLSYKLEQSQLQEQLKMQYECSTSYATVNELESQIENLTNELKSKSNSIQELETQVKNLEEELSKQAERFELDTEEMIRAKVEQEQRAIQAEETLRKVKLQNASTAGKLQEEFRKLSIQMTSAFRGNENAAMKAMDEAVQLRIEKKHLEEILKKVKQEFDHLGNQYEDKIADLSNQLTLKSKQVSEMEKQVENLSQELTHQKASYNAMIEDLVGELSDRETEIRLVKVELESLENEFKDLKKVKTEKDNEVERLQTEIERLKSRCNDMKQFCKENELEKENMKKQLVQLKGDLKKKDEAIVSIEKRVKEGSKPTPRNNNKTTPVSRSPKEVNNMKDKVKLLENQINLKEIALERAEALFLEKEKDLKLKIENLERRVAVLDHDIENPQVSTAQNPNPAIGPDGNQEIFKASPDVTELLNKNKCMEVELKEMQERYSEISLKFAEVEGERQQLVMSLRNLKNAKLMVRR